MKKITLYILFLLLATGCKKIQSDLENTINTEPIYKIKGQMDMLPFDFIMDGSNVLMNYGEESVNGVPAFYTVFEDIENSKALKLSIIAPEKISFLVHQPGCYNLGFSETPPNPPIIMCQVNGQQFENTESINLLGYGMYDIPVRFKGLSSETFSFTINHGFNSTNWVAHFNVHSSQSGIVFESNNSSDNHQWFLDGQAIGQNANGIFTTSNGIHTLNHLLSDNLGNKCNYSQIFYVHENEVKWLFKTDPCSSSVNESNFESVLITYKDKGVTYSSAFSEENIDNSLSLKNIEYFIENSSSSAISVKFDIAFNGVLYNEDKSKKIELSDVEGTCKYTIE